MFFAFLKFLLKQLDTEPIICVKSFPPRPSR